MELRVLNYFLTVAKEGNITRAAELLHITQPTLSRQLIELESELGVQLFHRGKRQVTLTEAGILLQQRAKEIVSLVEKTQRDLENQMDMVGGAIAIGWRRNDGFLVIAPSVTSLFPALSHGAI